MASTPEPVADEPGQLPDAANAAMPGHLLRALEWRTTLEYLAARRAVTVILCWCSPDSWQAHFRPSFCVTCCAA
jgi:hypothetical protein